MLPPQVSTCVCVCVCVCVKKNRGSSYLKYYDAHNLYGWAMSQALPRGKLKWVKENNYEKVLQDIVISNQSELDILRLI